MTSDRRAFSAGCKVNRRKGQKLLHPYRDTAKSFGWLSLLVFWAAAARCLGRRLSSLRLVLDPLFVAVGGG